MITTITLKESKIKPKTLPPLYRVQKFYFRFKSDESIQKLWGEIIKEINEIMIQNSIEMTKQDQDKTLNVFSQIRKGKKNV